MKRRRPRVPDVLVLRIVTDTVLDIGRQEWPVETVADLDDRLDYVATEIANYRVRPVEVILCDNAEGPALFIGIGAGLSYAVYLSRKGNQFQSVGRGAVAAIPELEVPARALIPNSDAREAMRQFLTSRCMPAELAWEQIDT